MLRSAATPNPRKQPPMPDDNPKLTTSPYGVGRWRCALRRAEKTPPLAVGLRLFED
jgi:hypothetical protein